MGNKTAKPVYEPYEEGKSPFQHDYGVPPHIDEYGTFLETPDRNECTCVFWPWVLDQKACTK